MNKEIKNEEIDKLLEDELFREAKMIEKSLLGNDIDEPSASEEEIDAAYERFMQRVKAEGLLPEKEGEIQTAEIVKFPGSRAKAEWERESEETWKSTGKDRENKLFEKEGDFYDELSDMISSVETETRKSWYKLGKVSGFILLAAIGILAGSMASQADSTKFVNTIEHIIDNDIMP